MSRFFFLEKTGCRVHIHTVISKVSRSLLLERQTTVELFILQCCEHYKWNSICLLCRCGERNLKRHIPCTNKMETIRMAEWGLWKIYIYFCNFLMMKSPPGPEFHPNVSCRFCSLVKAVGKNRLLTWGIYFSVMRSEKLTRRHEVSLWCYHTPALAWPTYQF